MMPEEQGLKELRILAVDDEESNLLLLRRILEREGYTKVEVTTDPSRVPAMFLENRPALVLLDLHMPEMDGFELMERLRSMAGDERGVHYPHAVEAFSTLDHPTLLSRVREWEPADKSRLLRSEARLPARV